MSEVLSDNEEIYAQHESALDGALSAYIAELTHRVPETIFFRTGAGRIFRDLLLHWPAVEGWEDEAQSLCQRITDAVYPLTESLFAQAVEMAVTISSMPIEAPAHIEAMSTYVVFDTEEHLERQCFLSPQHPVPQAEMLHLQKGVVVLCRPLHYRYHTISDDRKRIVAPGVGMYELVERQINALYDLPEGNLNKPLIDSLKTDIHSLPQTMERYEEERQVNLAVPNRHLSLVIPAIAAISSLSALPAPVRALEHRLMTPVVDSSLPPELRMGLRQIAQNLRALYPQTEVEEAAHQETAPRAFQIPSPAPSPYVQDQQNATTLPQAASMPLTNILAASPVAASGLPAQKNRTEQEHQARSDAQYGRLPDPTLYGLGDQYYHNAYDTFMAGKAAVVSAPPMPAKQASFEPVQQSAAAITPGSAPLISAPPLAATTAVQVQAPQAAISSAVPPAPQLPSNQMAQQPKTRPAPTSPHVAEAINTPIAQQTTIAPTPTASSQALPQSRTPSVNPPVADKAVSPSIPQTETVSADHRVAENPSRPTTQHTEAPSVDHRAGEDPPRSTEEHANTASTDHRVTEDHSRSTAQHGETSPSNHRELSEKTSDQTTQQRSMRSTPRAALEQERAISPALKTAQGRYKRFTSPQKMPVSRQTDRFFSSSSRPYVEQDVRPRGFYDRLNVSAPSALHSAFPAVAVGTLGKNTLQKGKKKPRALFSKSPRSAIAVSGDVLAAKINKFKKAQSSKTNKGAVLKAGISKARSLKTFPAPWPIPSLPIPIIKI
jgi:hypothetical protein